MSETPAASTIGTLFKLLATVVVAGALVAGMMLPFVGGTGLVARNSASLLDALPVELTDQTPNGNTLVLAADGSVITNFYENNRTPVTADEISDVMKQAIVDIEDTGSTTTTDWTCRAPCVRWPRTSPPAAWPRAAGR